MLLRLLAIHLGPVVGSFFQKVSLDLFRLHCDTISLVVFFDLYHQSLKLRPSVVSTLGCGHERDFLELLEINLGLERGKSEEISHSWRTITFEHHLVVFLQWLLLKDDFDTAFWYLNHSHFRPTLNIWLL